MWIVVALAHKKSPVISGASCTEPETSSGWNHAYELATLRPFDLEFHKAICCCEQRVVSTATDILTGMHLGAALTNDDVARADLLAAIHLDAKAFRF